MLRVILFFLYICFGHLYADEKLYFPLDARKWSIGFQEKNEQAMVIELILQNEEINDWIELLTIQRFPNLQLSGQEFMDALERDIKKNVKQPQTLKFQMIETDPVNLFENSFIFNRSKDKGISIIGYDEYNLGRVLKGKSAIYYIRYSSKNKNEFDKDKEDWVERLSWAYLASAPHPSQQGHWITVTANGVYEGNEQMLFQPNKQFIDYTENGYTLTLARTWLLENQSVKESFFDPKHPYIVSLLFSSPEQAIYGGTAFLETPKDDPSFEPLSEYWSLFQKQYPQAKQIKTGELQTILGLRGTYLIIEEGSKQGWVTFYKTNERIFRLELWTKSADFEKFKSEIEKISLNFETTKKVPSIK